jgi:hypothetical protein
VARLVQSLSLDVPLALRVVHRRGRLQRDERAGRASAEAAPMIALAVVLSFSVLVTIHVTGSVALTRIRPHWNGAVAFVVPPFFPYYAVRQNRAGWAIAWTTAAVAYAVALGIAVGWR